MACNSDPWLVVVVVIDHSISSNLWYSASVQGSRIDCAPTMVYAAHCTEHRSSSENVSREARAEYGAEVLPQFSRVNISGIAQIQL